MQQALDFLSKETIFQTIIATYGLPTVPSRPQGFQTLVLLILEQQVSIDSAKATFDRLKTLTPNFVPEEIALLSDEQMRAVGISRQKTNYIKGLANAIINNEIDLESLPQKPAQIVREELIKLKGIGNWTIDVYLMFCLQSPDIIPLGDIAVVNTIKELFDIHTKEEMEIVALNWSPYRSMATYLLWHHYLNKRNRKVNYSL
jgi:DNA-3-methyladenine glycosylase II